MTEERMGMPRWIGLNTSLTGTTVDLAPLEPKHFFDLAALAFDKRIWEFCPFNCSDAGRFREIFNDALSERDRGTQFPFVVIHKAHGKFIGGTRFLDIQQSHRKLEIGWTWLAPDYWATPANLECKMLLMTFGFETLRASRIQLKADENDQRSRKVLERMGGRFEGILRNDMIRDNQTIRHSAMYSIIDTDWEMVKPKLTALCREQAGG